MVTNESGSGMTRSSLLARARRQDPRAWSDLVTLYGPLIAHWCQRSGFDSHASADLLQEVFSAVAKSIHRFEPVRASGSFRAWLWTIASNKIRDAVVREGRHVAAAGGSVAREALESVIDPMVGFDEQPSDQVQINQLLRRGLSQIRDEFTEKTWEMFDRSVVDGISTAQVADEFSVSAATVRQTRSRVLRRLRVHLGDLDV